MSIITIEAIKAEQSRLADMIAAFEAQPKARPLLLPAQQIALNDGEHYAGILLGKEDEESHHLILLPGEATEVDWEDAKAWAAKTGGELPTRREQSLLYANLKDQFQSAWYWSAEQHAANSDYAWAQHFGNGYQNRNSKYCEFRARAVRRLAIQ